MRDTKIEREMAGKPVSESASVLATLVEPSQTNAMGNIHGGVIMKLADQAGAAAAIRHAGRICVTVSVDSLDFLNPVHVGDLLHTHAQVNWTGNTSMEIGVRVEAERWDEAGAEAQHVASAYLVFVAIDAEGKPRAVPPLILQSFEDERRNNEARIRRTHRLARRAAILASREAP